MIIHSEEEFLDIYKDYITVDDLPEQYPCFVKMSGYNKSQGFQFTYFYCDEASELLSNQ